MMDFSKWANIDITEVEKGEGEYKEVSHGKYEVGVQAITFKESKKGDPMITIEFKILAGDFKNSRLWYNQVITQSFQRGIVSDFLTELGDGKEFKFRNWENLQDDLDAVKEIADELGYVLSFEANKKGFDVYKILEVFDAEE